MSLSSVADLSVAFHDLSRVPQFPMGQPPSRNRLPRDLSVARVLLALEISWLPLINTQLQLGETAFARSFNRFNGFPIFEDRCTLEAFCPLHLAPALAPVPVDVGIRPRKDSKPGQHLGRLYGADLPL